VIALAFRAVLVIGTLLAVLAVAGLAQPPRFLALVQEGAR
jgi:hypothetical protein